MWLLESNILLQRNMFLIDLLIGFMLGHCYGPVANLAANYYVICNLKNDFTGKLSVNYR